MKVEIDSRFLEEIIASERATIFSIFLSVIALTVMSILYIVNTAIMLMKGYNLWHDYAVNGFLLFAILFNIYTLYKKLTIQNSTRMMLRQHIDNVELSSFKKL